MVYGRIYSIRSHQSIDIYIGSTTQPLSKRMANHRDNYKKSLDGKYHYITSFEILKHEDAYIELIFEGEFESKDSLRKKEGEYQREMKCVNKRIENRTDQEWREENKEQIALQKHKYYENNKEYRAEMDKKYREENKEHRAEIHKQWYENNKEYRAEMDKKYREENKEKISKREKQKYECECGGCFTHQNKLPHIKTIKHQLFLQNQKLNIVSV